MKRHVIDGVWLALGAILQGVAMAIFLFPHSIPSGGAAGLAILLEFLFDFSYEWSLWGLNLTLLMIAIRWLGWLSAVKTLYTVSITALTVAYLVPLFGDPLSYVWIDLSVGAGIFGIGVGLLFCKGASSGGIAILAHVLHRLIGVLPGKSLFWLNSVIFIATALFIDIMIIFYAFVGQWISTKIIDFIYTNSRSFYKQRKKSTKMPA